MICLISIACLLRAACALYAILFPRKRTRPLTKDEWRRM